MNTTPTRKSDEIEIAVEGNDKEPYTPYEASLPPPPALNLSDRLIGVSRRSFLDRKRSTIVLACVSIAWAVPVALLVAIASMLSAKPAIFVPTLDVAPSQDAAPPPFHLGLAPPTPPLPFPRPSPEFPPRPPPESPPRPPPESPPLPPTPIVTAPSQSQPPPSITAAACDDSCEAAADGDCDDGGDGATYTYCGFGTE